MPTPLRFLSPLHKALRQVSLHLDGSTKALGVISSERHLLSYLYSYGPCAIAEIQRVFGHKRSTLTSILNRLAARGLITRAVHPKDRRSFLIALTGKGRRLARELRGHFHRLESRIQALLDKASMAGFHRVLSAIASVTKVEVRGSRND